MKVVPAADISPQAWDAACERSRHAWLFHRRAWIEIEERFFGHRNLSFAVVSDDQVIGVQPLYASELGIGWIERLVHSGIHRHTGFAAGDEVPGAIAREAAGTAMREVLRVAQKESADRIQLNSQNLAPINLGPGREEVPLWVREYGFDLGMNFGPNGMLPVPGMATSCADQIVFLQADEETLFNGLSKNCRTAVRQAQNAGVEFDDRQDAAAMDDYWTLAQLAAERTGEKLPGREYYDTLDRVLRPDGRLALLFAVHGGVRVAAVMLAVDKNAISYLGGVSNPQSLPMRVNNFVHWEVIRWAKRSGHTHYRFGPAFPQVPADWPIARVSRFKEQFGARSVTTIQGSLFLHPEKYLAGGVEHLSTLCQPRINTGAPS